MADRSDHVHPTADLFSPSPWQIGQTMFQETKKSTLKAYTDAIQREFRVNWGGTTWQDCSKPLISALAVRLYLEVSPAHQDICSTMSGWQRRSWGRQGGPTWDKCVRVDFTHFNTCCTFKCANGTLKVGPF